MPSAISFIVKTEAEKAENGKSLKSENTTAEKQIVSKTELKIPAAAITGEKERLPAGLPERLIIPSLGLEAKIQPVGLTAAGEMSAPNNPEEAAWFKLGTRPGQIGSAVIAGHLDSAKGEEAVFWNLRKLRKESEVYIIDDKNNRVRFKVTGSELYDAENVSLESIFGRSDKARLNLITCGGVWNKEKNNYSKRLVVFTEAI